jgi:predicted nucleotidyltransferase
MDITNMFKSNTRKELFRLYFTNPESEYYLRELERILDIPVSMIRKELVRLEREGMFLSYKRGNQTHYRLNKAYALFSELKSIVFKTIGIEGTLKNILANVKGIEAAFIYGSFAKRNEKPTSDIDLLIIGDIDEDFLVQELRKIENEIKREVNYTLFLRNEFKKKKTNKDSFVLDLIANPKIFLIGGQDGL